MIAYVENSARPVTWARDTGWRRRRMNDATPSPEIDRKP